MALIKQLIDIPTTAGIDTKTDSVNDVPPAMSDILNLRATQTGAYDPRNSFVASPALAASETGFVVEGRDAAFSVVDRYLYKNIDGTNTQLAPLWNPAASHYDLGGEASAIGSGFGCEKPSCVALTNNGFFYAWSRGTSSIGYQFISSEGKLIASGRQTVSGTLRTLRVSAAPNGAAIAWVVNTADTLSAYLITTTTSTAITLPSTSVKAMGVEYDSANTCWFLGRHSSTSLILDKLTLSGSTMSVAATDTISASISAPDVDVVRTTNYVVLAYMSASTTVTAKYYNTSLSVQATQTRTLARAPTYRMSFGACEIASDQIFCSIGIHSDTDGIFLSAYKFNTSTATTVWDDASVGFFIMSAPICLHNRAYVYALDAALRGTQSAALLQIANFDGGTESKIELVTNWAADKAAGPTLYGGTSVMVELPNQTGSKMAKTAATLAVPYLFMGSLTYNTTTAVAGNVAGIPSTLIESTYSFGTFFAGAMHFSLTEPAHARSQSLGTASAIFTTANRSIDGAGQGPSSPWPVAFPLQKELLTSGVLPAARYTYVFVKTWTDSLGNQQTLEGFPIITNTTATYNRFRFYFPPSAFYVYNTVTSGASTASIEVYRTEGDGTIPYLLTTLTPTSTSPYIDNSTDEYLILSAPLPSSSGELTTSIVPGANASTGWKDRVAIIPIDDPNKVYYSKPSQALRAPAFAAGLEIGFPQAQEPLSALGSMDGVLYAFTPNQVYTVYGDPAGNTGEGGSLTIPEIRFNGVGCEDPASVLLTPSGLFFKSAKGFYLILRNQELTFIGDGPFSDRGGTVVGAWASENTSEAAFALDSGVVWVYDWGAKLWSRWTPPVGNGDTITGASLINGLPTYITQDAIYQETTANSETIPISVTTAWIRLGALQGYQRVYNMWLYLELLAAHTLTVDMYLDGSETSVYTWTITSSGLGSSTPEQIRLSVPYQKCSAIKLKIASTNAGWKLKGIMAEIGVKDSSFKSRNAPNNY